MSPPCGRPTPSHSLRREPHLCAPAATRFRQPDITIPREYTGFMGHDGGGGPPYLCPLAWPATPLSMAGVHKHGAPAVSPRPHHQLNDLVAQVQLDGAAGGQRGGGARSPPPVPAGPHGRGSGGLAHLQATPPPTTSPSPAGCMHQHTAGQKQNKQFIMITRTQTEHPKTGIATGPGCCVCVYERQGGESDCAHAHACVCTMLCSCAWAQSPTASSPPAL